MNTLTLNNISLDGGNVIIKKGNNNSGGNGGGTAPVSKNDVTFYDYDGTILHSYTKDEFLALSAMPNLPERKGLICQEWNWDFEDAIAYVREYGILDVGATYITDDGKTRFYITIESKVVSTITLYFTTNSTNELAIDWGDGNSEIVKGYKEHAVTHNYNAIGNFVISLDTTELNKVAFNKTLLGTNPVICNMLKKCEFGIGITDIGENMFHTHRSLFCVTIPKNITRIKGSAFTDSGFDFIVIPKDVTTIEDSYAFSNCGKLSTVILPQSITTLGAYTFYYSSHLERIVIPPTVKILNSYLFGFCKKLFSVIVPQSVKTINSSSFAHCSTLCFLDFSKSVNVPSMASTNAIPSHAELRIIVPDDLYDTWIAATNWSTYASQIIKKSDWDASQA